MESCYKCILILSMFFILANDTPAADGTQDGCRLVAEVTVEAMCVPNADLLILRSCRHPAACATLVTVRNFACNVVGQPASKLVVNKSCVVTANAAKTVLRFVVEGSQSQIILIRDSIRNFPGVRLIDTKVSPKG
jgi:hypothetical protein